MSTLILYTTEDGRSQIRLRAKDQTVWLTQREMAQLFDVSTDNVGLHLKNIFEDGELNREATTEESSVVQTEGEREVQRPVTLSWLVETDRQDEVDLHALASTLKRRAKS